MEGSQGAAAPIFAVGGSVDRISAPCHASCIQESKGHRGAALCRAFCMSRLLQKDAEQEAQMRAEIQDMKQELSTVNMMDEFARYARLERKINKMTDKLKTHVKARTAQLAKIKWVISVAFYVLQAALMVSLIWKYYSVPVAVVPSKWITPLDRLVAFPTRVAGGVGITCWILVCNKVVAIVLHPFS
ncbi:tail-anchored protein insertion receptor WRB isoform X2 [Leptonychotes weddellii]|uniref:Guided entry of tail-anchored proteins factor 1 n=1 Tax=Leptonychotes weddellii TaxID=9713 RepID=A0A7F8R1B9_LEPWE|nr:tail-anchored protein insertion receptor WRB isoform X2 [Leptonychotes weddellii]